MVDIYGNRAIEPHPKGPVLLHSADGGGKLGLMNRAKCAPWALTNREYEDYLRMMATPAGPTTITATADQAKILAEAWKQGQKTRPIVDRKTQQVVGEITANGERVIRYPHTDQGTPDLHWNLEDKTTGENIHVVIK